jgi:CMP/dCMP kinase
MPSPSPFHIAIDGPAGSGKSTAAKGVARALGITHLDTGAMYRAVALKVRREGVEQDPSEWQRIAESADLSFRQTASGQRILLDGEDVEDLIRTPEMSELTSRVSADPEVRRAVTKAMRRMASTSDAVLEGRDIGTVVLPQAALKVYLVAPEEVRAARRAADLTSAGQAASEGDLRREIRERDARDSGRTAAPLLKAADAVELDTSLLDADVVAARIAELARERGFGS